MEEGQTIEEALRGEEESEVQVIGKDPMDAVREALNIGEGVDPITALLEAPKEAPEDKVYIPRLKAWFTVEAILDDKLYDQLVERCTKLVKQRRGGTRREVDGRRLARLTVAEFTVNPPFKSARGQEGHDALAAKYGTREPEDLVARALLIGEIDKIAEKILDLSGFEDEVDTAGN